MTNTVSSYHDATPTNGEEDQVVAISEQDFLARVAAFERNEELEAKLAKDKMKRMVDAQTNRRRRGECKPSVDEHVDERPRRTGASRTTIACQPPLDSPPLVYPIYEIPCLSRKDSYSNSTRIVGQIHLVPHDGCYPRDSSTCRISADSGMHERTGSVNPLPVYDLPIRDPHRSTAKRHPDHPRPLLAVTPVYRSHPPPRLNSTLTPPSSEPRIKYDLRTVSHVEGYYTSTSTANRIAYTNHHHSMSVPANPIPRGNEHHMNSSNLARASNLLHFHPRAPPVRHHHRSSKFANAHSQPVVKPLRA